MSLEHEILVESRDADHLADDVERQSSGDFLDEVDLPRRLDVVDDASGKALDVVLELVTVGV